MMALFEKIDASRILKQHFDTLGDIRGEKKVWDIIFFYVVPIFFGVAYYMYGCDCVTKECWGNLLIVNSIFLPLMLTALISLYSMRDRFADDKLAAKLLGQITTNTFYCILLSACAIVFSFVIDLGQWYECPITASIFIAWGIHCIFTVLMLIKRFFILFMSASATQERR